MIKVSHSNNQHWLALELSGTLTPQDIEGAIGRVLPALQLMDHGYTLIEVFRGNSHLEAPSAHCIGSLAKACYKPCRIWRVARVYEDNGSDPGLIITHRSRWTRRVPEIEVNDISSAIALAKEEVKENSTWL